jgi:hypothetical protein
MKSITKDLFFISIFAGFVFCQTANAQNKGQLGLTVNNSGAFGVLWNVTNRFALQSDILFSRASFDVPLTTSRSHMYTVGIKGLIYVHRWESLSVYIAPRLAVVRINSSTLISEGLGESLSTTYQYIGSTGLQYGLSRRFSVFGEIGLSFSDMDEHSNAVGNRLASSSEGKSVSPTGGVGIIFYIR